MIVKFKEVTDDVLGKMLNAIPRQEYNMISGLKIIITDSEYKKAQQSGAYTYHGIDIPIELIEENPSEETVTFGANYVEIMNHVASKFINSKPVVDTIYPAMMTGENVLLYGRGGHGKSEMVEEFMIKAKELGMIDEDPFVLSVGEGLTEEALFGGIEMKKFLETGEYIYLVENSFMNHKVVIIEEMFDAPAPILLSLKDILTSGYFRKGKQVFKIKTELVIGITNKSKEAFSEDDSLEALTQRFSATCKVEWETYTKNDFTKLFQKRFSQEYFKTHKSKLYDLASIVELNNQTAATFVSPRTAVKAAKMYCYGASLDVISDLDRDVVKKYFKENKDTAAIAEAEFMMGKATEYVNLIEETCKTFENNEMEDQILDLLGGDTANLGITKTLTEEEEKAVKGSIKRLEWTLRHVAHTSVPVICNGQKDELVKRINTFKAKLEKITTK